MRENATTALEEALRCFRKGVAWREGVDRRVLDGSCAWGEGTVESELGVSSYP